MCGHLNLIASLGIPGTNMQENPPRSIWTNPLHFVACAFGFGALPWWPGTWATLATIPIVIALKQLPEWGYVAVTLAMVLLGVFVCGKANRDFGTEDHPACAWDEMASFPIALIGVPLTIYTVLAAVILFRFLDIIKPWPIRWLDRHIHGGIGVMLDDVVAALCTLVILHAGMALQ